MPVAIVLLFASCKKDLQPRDLDFDVVSENSAKQPTLTFKVTDTVHFVFSGNPDHITFYSGEIGRKYANVNRVSDTSSNNVRTLSFSTALNTAGTGSLKLLIATKFPKIANINATDSLSILDTYPTNWTDITSRAALATNATVKASGAVNLADYAKAGEPVYLAFRYRAEAGVVQPRWTITNINLTHKTADTTYIINTSALSLPTAFPAFTESHGWVPINVANKLIKFTSFGVTGNTNAATAVATENWMITGPIDLSRVLPDAGVVIKDMTSNASTTIYGGPVPSTFANYAYKFKNRGTYNVTFFASTSTADKQVSKIKTLTLTIN